MMPPIPKLDLDRFRRLPVEASETWQGRLVRMPAWVEEPGVPPFRPYASLWVSTATKFAHAGEATGPDRDPRSALTSLLEFAFNRKLAGYRPGMLEVGDDDVAECLRRELSGLDIVIIRDDDLPDIDVVTASMRERMSEGKALPHPLQVEGVTLERLRSFARAAAAFYRAEPWEKLSGDDLIVVESPVPEPELSCCSVLGQAGLNYGLGFVASEEQFQEMLDSEGPGEWLRRRNHWLLSFDAITDIPLDDAELWEAHQLPLAGERAYPLALCSEPHARHRRPGPRVLSFLEALLTALAESSEDEIDAGRWTKTVPTSDGPQTITLAMPALLAPTGSPGGAGPRRTEFFDRRILERHQLQIQRLLAGREFESEEEMQDFVEREINKNPGFSVAGTTPRERAQDLVYEAVEFSGRRRIQLARRALKLWPECAEAYVLMAEEKPSSEKALEWFERGEAAGRADLGRDFFRSEVGRFWGLIETRPYMRARRGMADCMHVLGRTEEAITHYQELLRLNPDDNQGVRYALAVCLLETGQTTELGNLFRHYGDDVLAAWNYARALHAFIEEGDTAAARQLLGAAIRANPYAPKMLLGKHPIPEERPDHLRPGGFDDAVDCADALKKIWQATPGAGAWLDKELREKKKARRSRRK